MHTAHLAGACFGCSNFIVTLHATEIKWYHLLPPYLVETRSLGAGFQYVFLYD